MNLSAGVALGNTKRNILIAAVALFLAALKVSRGGSADDLETGWTDNLHSKDGIYAVRVDGQSRRVLLVRADNHALSAGTLFRVRLLFPGGALTVPLRQAGTAGPPWRFGAEVPGWDGLADAAELETSGDGKRWLPIGTFRAAKVPALEPLNSR